LHRRAVYRRNGLSLGCSKTLTITVIELRQQSFSFSVVVATDVNIEDVVGPTTLADRSYIGEKTFLDL